MKKSFLNKISSLLVLIGSLGIGMVISNAVSTGLALQNSSSNFINFIGQSTGQLFYVFLYALYITSGVTANNKNKKASMILGNTLLIISIITIIGKLITASQNITSHILDLILPLLYIIGVRREL